MAHNGKIWVQSCCAESDAGIWGAYQDSVRRHARNVLRPDLEPEFHGISRTYPGIDFVDSAVTLATKEVVANAIRAEEGNYAAFAFVSTNDAGNREVREVTDIPCAFIVDKNSTVIFPSPIMTTIAELTQFLSAEEEAAKARAQLDLRGSEQPTLTLEHP